MPKFILDGKEIPFEPGETVMQAAWREGIEIPHYCWHPGLSIAANCRMCLVQIESGRQMAMPQLVLDDDKGEYVPSTKPKLHPACQLAAVEDMVISSTNEEVKTAQASVQEFLLLNHPVDCPICDQAGECKLQDYYYEHQGTLKRKLTEPVHKPKGVRFGPTIIYDAERCIMCTRCIRVCDELAKDHVLDMRERGNRNEIFVAPGRELDHKYTLMTEHVCPVGALTSQAFRFKARVWFLKSGEGVCTGCATGCNTHVDYDPRYGKVYRLRPRDNADVNKFWMCDDGMMTYTRQDADRLLMPTAGRGEERVPVGEGQALELAAEKLKVVDAPTLAIVLSAQHTTEDNLALAKLAAAIGANRLYLAALGGWEGDEILRSDDNNPNRAGAIQSAGGATLHSIGELLSDVQSGAVQGVVALGWATTEKLEELAPLADLDGVISLTSHVGALPAVASIAIPVADTFEIDGSFINDKGMAQSFRSTLPTPAGVDPAWKTISNLARLLGKDLGFKDLQGLRRDLSDAVEAAQ
ncbi:MAG: 2Fe-2S iron-sulfur cluster-binding protein [Polyangiales bacterium]